MSQTAISKNKQPNITLTKKVLNVGGGSKNIPIPVMYQEYEHVLLDINPDGNPDIICDARELSSIGKGQYDAVYCSHNLEHYYHHEVPTVLAGFIHVMKEDGFVHIRVPDINSVMKIAIEKNLDLEDVLYHTAGGVPILVRDVIYGWSEEIEKNNNLYYLHKTGFTPKSLQNLLYKAGFSHIYTGCDHFEVVALACLKAPSDHIRKLFNITGA